MARLRIRGTFKKIAYQDDGTVAVSFEPSDASTGNGELTTLFTRAVIAADGAKSAVGRQTVPGADKMPFVFAYHEIVKSPEQTSDVFDGITM
jgi:geranylgeranyl reductase